MKFLSIPFHDPVSIFAVMLLVTLIAPILARKIKIPSIITLIFFGIIIGPFGLNVLNRDQAVELLSTIGILYIMFLSGLEIDLVQFKKNKSHSLIFGFMTFSIPLIMGILAGYYIIHLNFVTSLLLASMFSSHTLLTFPTVSQLGLSKKMSTATAVGGTIFTDILALLILAVISGGESGAGGFIFWIRIFVSSVTLGVIIIFIFPIVGRFFFKKSSGDGLSDYVFIMAMMFIAAFFSKLAGLEPIIGAFLAGMALNSLVPENSLLMNRIQFVGNSLFIPFFLLSVGMLVNIKMLFSGWTTALIIVVMISIALIAKWLAAVISGKILGYNKNESRLIYGLSVNQAAATLAAVLVGYRIGLFDEGIIAGTVAMILVSCMVGAAVTSFAARKLAVEALSQTLEQNGRPQRILIPVSNEKTASQLINLAFLIRKKGSIEPIYPIKIVDETEDVEEQIYKSEKILAPVVVQAVSAGVPAIPITRADINIVSGIQKAIVDLRISELILGWSGESSFSPFTESLNDKIIHQTEKMVLVCTLKGNLGVCNRMIFIIPAYADRHPGFEKMINRFVVLAEQLSTPVLIYDCGDSSLTIKNIISKAGSSLKITEEHFKDVEAALSSLKKSAENNDLLVLAGIRIGDVGWRPILNRLPRKLSLSFPDNSIIVMYMERPHYQLEVEDAVNQKNEVLCGLNQVNTIFSSEIDLPSSIYQLLLRKFEQETTSYVYPVMMEVAINNAVELCDGVLLLHSHIQIVTESQIFMGVNPSGYKIPGRTNPFYGYFMLIAPLEQPPEQHLSNLAAIAKLAGRKHFDQKIKQMKTYNEFVKFFSLPD